jgi:hypothetical protein
LTYYPVMADPQREHQPDRAHSAPAAAGLPASAQAGPGLNAVKAMTTQGDAAAAQVVTILRAHPTERDEILEWLHQHRGNAFVQQVNAKLGEVERTLPEGVDLQSVRASVTIPGKKRLAGSWKANVGTTYATTITVEVSTTGVRAWMSPAIHVDATWPLQNAEIRGAGLNFADGKSYANVGDIRGLGEGFISGTGTLKDMITDALDKGVAGTPLAKAGYQPVRDPDLSGTLQRVVAGFQGLTTDADHEGSGEKPPLTEKDLDDVSVGGTVALRTGGSFLTDGTGLVVAPGSTISVDVNGNGSVGDVAATKTPAAAADAAQIRNVRIAAGDMQVVSDGKPVAKIESLTIAPGGKVTIDQMTLLGKAARARNTEAGLSLLVALIAIGSRDGRAAEVANGAYRNANDPKLVDGVARKMIEDQFTSAVTKLVRENRGAVPGVDLAKILGL